MRRRRAVLSRRETRSGYRGAFFKGLSGVAGERETKYASIYALLTNMYCVEGVHVSANNRLVGEDDQ